MSVLKEEKFLHPLTDKWMPLVNRFANRYNKKVFDLRQEALILEWQMQKNKKFESEKHRENYFKKALYRNLYRRVDTYPHEWGILESGTNKNVALIHTNSIDVFSDFLIKMRPFDEIYYNEMINHTATLLAQKDLLASRIFLDRMNMQIKWKELRLKHYKKVNSYQFNKAVRLIRSVVRKEVAFA